MPNLLSIRHVKGQLLYFIHLFIHRAIYPIFIDFCITAKKSISIPAVAVDDRLACVHRADGNYAIRDVALYLICKNHKASEGTCASGKIFTPASGKCVSVSSVDPSEFVVLFCNISHICMLHVSLIAYYATHNTFCKFRS